MIIIGDRTLTLEDCYAVLIKDEPIELSESALKNISDNFNFLREFSSNKLIYGINTGFGPMAQYRISHNDQKQLQYNLIRSHCSGSGNMLPPKLAKALMLARLNSLMLGFSGIHPEAVELLCQLINKQIYPCIFEHGGVGASGDLVQLAHLALMLIGEGDVLYQGNVEPASNVFEKEKIKPIQIHIREGLSVINGTSAMTGVSIINLIHAKNLLNWSIVLSTMTNEIMEAFDDHLSVELNVVKKHVGQNTIARTMRNIITDSRMIKKRPDHLYKNIESEVLNDKVQEYYSLRCVPQILGPVLDTLLHAEKVIGDELNSVNDNPVVDHRHHNIYHGGNFHGDYVALEMDKLKIAITKLSMLAERQINFLMNENLNQKLPPFVNLGRLGLNLGMQGVQFTATSTVAENQTLSNPMYIHSIPNNNDNQDIVSMGCNAALMTRKVVENSYEVLAIQMMTVLQAIDYLNIEDRLSSYSRQIYASIREIFPCFIEDLPKYKDQKAVKDHLMETRLNLIRES